jgi:hypothetical protein
MKRRTIYLQIFFTAVVSVCSLKCSTSNRIYSNKEGNNIEKLLVFSPVSNIYTIRTKDRGEQDEELSIAASSEVKKQLLNFVPAKISAKYFSADTIL